MNKPVTRILLYNLCLYNIYLFLPDALDIFKIDFYPPDPDVLTYFDAVLFMFGGAILGWLLIKSGKKFDKRLGWLMVAINVVLVPVFIYRAIP